MIGRKQEINLQLSQIIDSALIALAFWLSHSLRFYLLPLYFPDLPQIPDLNGFAWLMAIIIPFAPIVLELEGYYRRPLRKRFHHSIAQFARTGFWLLLFIGACVIFFKWRAGSRVVLMLFPPIAATFLLTKEALVKRHLRRRAIDGGDKERVVVVGLSEDIAEVIAAMGEDEASTMAVVAEYNINDHSVEGFTRLLHEKSASRVIFAAGHTHFGKVQEAIHACEQEGVEAWLSTDFFQTAIARPNFDVLGGRLMLVFTSTPEISWSLLLKEVFDRVAAFLLIVLTSPIWLVAYIGIKLKSPGPTFFHQDRCGRNGMPFKMIKFRTMCLDAEDRQAELMAENEMQGPVFKVEDDPRIFPFGRTLRRISADELPQLLNVLRGEMSLVGPRPLPVHEINRIENSAQRRRLSVKPGITCLWQVSGRNQITSFEDWVALDLKYIDNWSIWLDLKILLQTVPVVIRGNGAS